MVNVKHNLKDTDIICIVDKKNIEIDIDKIIEEALKCKKLPFHDVFILIQNDIPSKYLEKLNKKLYIKNIIKNKDKIKIKL